MTTKKCDRCGKYEDDFAIRSISSLKLIDFRPLNRGLITFKRDLCNDCFYELRKFLKETNDNK